MARRRTETLLVTKVDPAGARRGPDQLIVEEPMSIQLDGTLVTTTMRTPGDDFELAAGFCFTEGLLGGARVTGARYCATGSAVESRFNIVTVETANLAPVPTPRLRATSSSCGVCGTESVEALLAWLAPLPAGSLAPFALDVLAQAPRRVLDGQVLFASTGAVHAAAALTTDGEVLVVREDVGRHNAVDKVIGHLLLSDRLPARDLALYVSGRASFEMVQKAWAGGFAALVSVSAPTALAVHTARTAGLLLAGFVRDGSLNVYAPERLERVGGLEGLGGGHEPRR